MTTKICKSVFSALIDDLKEVNNHNFDLLEIKLSSTGEETQSKSLNPPKDLDNYDSDNETVSERAGGFLFKDSYFEDREVENLVLEYDPMVQCRNCECEHCVIEPVSFVDQPNTDKINSGNQIIEKKYCMIFCNLQVFFWTGHLNWNGNQKMIMKCSSKWIGIRLM